MHFAFLGGAEGNTADFSGKWDERWRNQERGERSDKREMFGRLIHKTVDTVMDNVAGEKSQIREKKKKRGRKEEIGENV